MLTEANGISESMIDPALRDGYEVHRAALARGLNVTLLPRQVMTVETPQGEQHTFIHGIPQTSTLAGVTYAQDKRMRRALLERSGFAVPRGATFSVGRSADAARRFADRIGYPVVVKPAIGDNTTEVMGRLHDVKQLDEAIEYLRTPPHERANYTRAAYALTELREPDTRRGRVMVPPGYRFLVEKHISGEYLRILILEGRVRNILLCPDGPWDSKGNEMQNVTDDIHPSIKQIAVDSSRTIPGLPLVAIDMIVPDSRVHTIPPNAVIVEYSERPWLATQAAFDTDLSATLAYGILETSISPLASNRNQVTVTAQIEATVEPALLLHALSTECQELGIVGHAKITDSVSGKVSATMQGEPSLIAWIAESLIAGNITHQRPMLVAGSNTAPIKATSFTTP